jgi:hypothetical protein
VIDSRPDSGNSNYELITYSCNQTASVSNSQIKLNPTYDKNNCDNLSAQTVTTQSSISVSISTSVGSKCGKANGKKIKKINFFIFTFVISNFLIFPK